MKVMSYPLPEYWYNFIRINANIKHKWCLISFQNMGWNADGTGLWGRGRPLSVRRPEKGRAAPVPQCRGIPATHSRVPCSVAAMRSEPWRGEFSIRKMCLRSTIGKEYLDSHPMKKKKLHKKDNNNYKFTKSTELAPIFHFQEGPILGTSSSDLRSFKVHSIERRAFIKP